MTWTPAQIEELRSSGKGERYALERLEAAALLFLNERDALLCSMSAMDGEWPEDAGIDKKRVRRLRVLMGIINEEADGTVSEQDEYDLVSGILDLICETHRYDAVVWDLKGSTFK